MVHQKMQQSCQRRHEMWVLTGGVTIKMSRHWMRLLNTRIYAAHYIPSRAHCPYNIHSVSSKMPQCTSHTYLPVYCGDTFELFLHLLIQHGRFFFCLQTYAANIFSNFRLKVSWSGLVHIGKQGQTMAAERGLWTNWAFPFCMRRERRGNARGKKSRREHW